MIRSTTLIGLAACGFFACSESSPIHPEPEPEPEEVLGPIEAMSPVLSLGGVVAQQDSYAPMVTLDGATHRAGSS